MKKVFLILTICSFLCAVPAQAKKLIMNVEGDRTVHSRAMGGFDVVLPELPEKSMNEVDSSVDTNVDKNVINGVYIIPGYQAEKFEALYRPELERDIRRELIGTTWKYPDYAAIKARYAQAAMKSNTKTTKVKTQKAETKQLKATKRRYGREASDYYYRDTLNNPNQILRSGFDIIIKE